MKLLPIDVDEANNLLFQKNTQCLPILEVYPGYYQKIGYQPPWIGYFASNNDNDIVGCGGFKGKPINGKIEIAYGTFKPFEGKGIGKEICRLLVLLARQSDPAVRITARTLQDNYASIGILKSNGFECLGTVQDEEDGEVLEWEFKKAITN